MKNQTKIIVLHAKELIYTGILAALIILVIVFIILLFKPAAKPDETKETTSTYVAGVYKTSIMLNQTPVDVTVTVDSDHINSIEIVNLSESVAAMYPLLQPSLDSISSQVCQNQSTENITYSEESKYTSMLLIDAINKSLEKAKP